MTNKHTNAHAKRSDGTHIAVQSTQTDVPIIPVAALERLHSFRPDRVDWVFKQGEIESEARRSETRRINTFVFVEHIIGAIGAAIMGIVGVVGGSYIAVRGHDLVGGIIATTTIGALAVNFLYHRRHEQK